MLARLNLSKLISPSILRHCFSSSQEVKPPNSNQTESSSENISQTQQQLIKSFKVDETWNQIMGHPKDFNYQKELIIRRKQFQGDRKQLAQTVLFQDLLKSQINIVVYDTEGKPYYHQLLKMLLKIAASLAIVGYWHYQMSVDYSTRVLIQMTGFGGLVYLVSLVTAFFTTFRGLRTYRKMQKRYVERIVYSTQTQNFKFTKRTFTGVPYQTEVSRFKLVYTENPMLTVKGTNYFHLQTYEQYAIGYRFAWKKQQLFSHLIAQRIRV